MGILTPSDQLLNGYVAVLANINPSTARSDSVAFADGVTNKAFIVWSGNQFDPTGTSYTNWWVNDVGSCYVNQGGYTAVNGVPDGCSDPPSGPLQSQLVGWSVYAAISVDISQGTQNIPDTGQWSTHGVEVVDSLFTQTVLFAAVESPPLPY